MATWLNKLPHARINCNAKKVREALQNVQLDEDEQLISLDVESLFTNVPVKEAIEYAARLLYDVENLDMGIDRQTFEVAVYGF